MAQLADPMTPGAPSTRDPRQLRGWQVLLMFLAFFGVIFAVNGVFLYSAITSFPGEDVKKSYLQGLSYGDTLEQRARQADMGWRAGIGVASGGVVLELADRAGAPVSGLIVTGELRRKVTRSGDVDLVFSGDGAGAYLAALDQPLEAGEWAVTVRAYEHADAASDPMVQPIFVAGKTLYVP